MVISSPEALERKKAWDRERIARRRDALTPEERAERRRKHDEDYRRRHVEERMAYERRRHFVNRIAAFSRTRVEDVKVNLDLGRSFVVDKRSPDGRWV